MSTSVGQLRRYDFEFVNPVPPSCSDFQKYIETQINGTRKMIGMTVMPTSNDCKIELAIECWSTGNGNAANLLNSIIITFPKVEVKNFIRKRYSKSERQARTKRRKSK